MTGDNGNDFVSELICLVLNVFMIVLFIRVVLSWIQLAGWRPPHSGPLRAAFDVVIDVTEPPLRLLRRIVPPAGVLDLSVLVAFVVLVVLSQVFC
ncbi:MAG TPA: YggT family protein [Actinomycetota bacterium]|nr:YggT family protein [Actinomycetota bacterium]